MVRWRFSQSHKRRFRENLNMSLLENGTHYLREKESLSYELFIIFYDAQSSLVSESAVQQRKSGLTRGFLLPQLMTKNVCTSAEWYRTIGHDESQSVS